MNTGIYGMFRIVKDDVAELKRFTGPHEGLCYLILLRENSRIFSKETEQQTGQEDIQRMLFRRVFIMIDGLDVIIEPPHFLAGFGVRRMFGIGDGLLVLPRQWQKKLVIRLEITVIERCLVFDCSVIGHDRLVIRDKDEANLVLLNHRKAQRLLKSLFNRGTVRHRMKVKLLGQRNITGNFGNVALYISHLKTLARRIWNPVG